jgi:Serine carboxypeptidase S28
MEVRSFHDALSVARAVQATNEYTGEWHLQGTRILSATGTVDPWTEMSLQNTRGRSRSHNDTTGMLLYSVPAGPFIIFGRIRCGPRAIRPLPRRAIISSARYKTGCLLPVIDSPE